MAQIEVRDLVFRYNEEDPEATIKGVSFDIEKGTYTTIIGHNGSGKSTIAKLLVGLLEKESGSIKIDGEEITPENVYEIRRKVAIVFQNPDNQFIGSTVRDDIAFGLENHQVEPGSMDQIINFFAKEVNMADFLNHEPIKLSGGQKQRVAIAGVLAMAPEILILDEATAMLDPAGKQEIKELVLKLHERHDMTIISITHDIEEVSMSDKVIVMNDGQIRFNDTPDDILVLQKELIDIQLDVPFSVKLAQLLETNGVKLSDPLDEEKIVEELCQYNSRI